MEDKIVIGVAEKVKVFGPNGEKEVVARIDTGARTCSMDTELAAELNLGPILKTKEVKQALGVAVRPIIEVEIELAGKKLKSEFTLANRSHMNYAVLIGRNLLKNGFLIDPSK